MDDKRIEVDDWALRALCRYFANERMAFWENELQWRASGAPPSRLALAIEHIGRAVGEPVWCAADQRHLELLRRFAGIEAAP